jgi:hypothetical protein
VINDLRQQLKDETDKKNVKIKELSVKTTEWENVTKLYDVKCS